MDIRVASIEDFATAVDWAAAEGWDPGLDDLEIFHGTDPSGFLMGYVGETPVSSISVVKYGGGYGFLGFYIVHPDYRGQGHGIATWNAGMAYLAECTIGLDGVVAQQDNYRQSGFVLTGRNIRHSGMPSRIGGGDRANCVVRAVQPDDLDAVADYDARHFPVPRDSFITGWILPDDPAPTRLSLIAIRDGEIKGFGTIRTCRTGNKIGPLFAEDASVAAALFDGLCSLIPDGAAVSLDTPEDNRSAVAMAVRAGLEPVFETARMYKGQAPDLPIGQIFGVTTFELG